VGDGGLLTHSSIACTKYLESFSLSADGEMSEKDVGVHRKCSSSMPPRPHGLDRRGFPSARSLAVAIGANGEAW
jgi:hypothetical protein